MCVVGVVDSARRAYVRACVKVWELAVVDRLNEERDLGCCHALKHKRTQNGAFVMCGLEGLEPSRLCLCKGC